MLEEQHPKRPGELAFVAMQARFAEGPVVHYRSDFDHDQRLVRAFMVLGARALWHLRPTGTELTFLGVADRSSWLETVRRLASPEETQLFLVLCEEHATKVELITPDKAASLARARPLLDVTCWRDAGGHRLSFRSRSADSEVAAASFSARRQVDSATLIVDAKLDFLASLVPCEKLVARLQLEEQVTQALGSLFWRFDRLVVDGQDGDAWLEQLGAPRRSS